MIPTACASQGGITMWLQIESEKNEEEKQEIVQKGEKPGKLKHSKQSLWDIEPEPSAEYQIRVCVFGTSAVP